MFVGMSFKNSCVEILNSKVVALRSEVFGSDKVTEQSLMLETKSCVKQASEFTPLTDHMKTWQDGVIYEVGNRCSPDIKSAAL
jgi:hypothetical protein